MMRKEFVFTSFVAVLMFFLMQHYQGTLITLIVFSMGMMLFSGAMIRDSSMYFGFLINANPGVWELIRDRGVYIQNKKRINDISRTLILSIVILFYSATVLKGGKNFHYSMSINGFEYTLIAIASWIVCIIVNNIEIWQLKKFLSSVDEIDLYQ